MSTEDPRAAAIKWHRDRRDKLDRMIRDGAESPHLGVRMASENLKVERDHLVHLLGAIGEQDLRMYAAGIAEGYRRAALEIAMKIAGLCPEPGAEHAGEHCDFRTAALVAQEVGEQPGGTT